MTDHHTPITEGAAANASVFNAPLAELDAAVEANEDRIDAIEFTPSGVAAEFLNGDLEFEVPVGTGDTNGHVIQNDSGSLNQRLNLLFTGPSVTASDETTETQILIDGSLLDKNTETLSGTKTLADGDEAIQYLDPGGSGRDVNLPAEASTNQVFYIINTADGDEDLTVKDDSPATILTVGQDQAALFVSDGTSWSGYFLLSTISSGDMAAATYDPATISEQLVGLTAEQTLTNKTLTSPVINGPATGTGIGIGDNDLVQIDSESVADDEYARFTANGLESRSTSEVLSDIGAVAKAGDTMAGDLQGGNNALYGFEGEINAQTGTTYTLLSSDCGKIVTLNNGSAITLTVGSALPAGFNCIIIQLGAGQVTVAAGGTGNIRNYDSHTKLAGQYAAGSLVVVSNAGTAPEVYFAGRTAA